MPTVTWFKDDEVLTTKTHTENYNGFPNKYVPDGRIEVIRLGKKLKSLNLKSVFCTTLMLEKVSRIHETYLLDQQLFSWRHFSKIEVVQNTDLNILAL